MADTNDLTLFGGGFINDELNGNPRMIRVLRRPIDPRNAAATHMQEEAHYRLGGQLSERSAYRDDGSLSYRWIYDYADNGDLLKVLTLEVAGNVVNTCLFRKTDEGQEQRLLDAAGATLETTIVRTSVATHTTEQITVDDSGVRQAYCLIHHDIKNRPIRGELQVSDAISLRFVVNRDQDNRNTLQFYRDDGSVAMESDFNDDVELERRLYSPGNGVREPGLTERIDTRDHMGNWTQKTLIDPGGKEHVIVTRKITYYPNND